MQQEHFWELIAASVFAGSMLAGVVILGNWLIDTRCGLNSLNNTPTKRTDMELHTPFVLMFCWLAASALGGLFGRDLSGDESLSIYIIRLFTSSVFAIIGLFLASRHFPRGIRGLGINFRTLPKDLWWGFVNLLAARPLIFLGLFAVGFFGKLFFGEDFQIEKHQSLETIAANKDFLLLAVMMFLISVVTPIFEEILFRGIIQSTINSYLSRPWISIFITSVIFSSLHPMQHFLAVFALSACMGYSYQKSGSLLRPILIHSLFNTANTVTALLVSF